MALTQLQKHIVAAIAGNRTATSYLAGGIILNMDWPRLSDDIDIFHDTDEEIGPAAEKDMQTLREQHFRVSIAVMIYGCVKAAIVRDGEKTRIRWMSESRTRFFPVMRDKAWGMRLHPTDLAINDRAIPVNVSPMTMPGVQYRKAATKQEPIPAFPDAEPIWTA